MFPRLVHLDERLQSQQLNLPSALVIEEDEDFRFCLVEFLRRQGWIAHGVRRGEQALPILAHLPCHLIVVGSDLPGMPGIDFARILHTSRRWRASPFVIIARLFNQAFATELAEFGAFLVRKIGLGGRALWHFGRLARRCGYEAEILEQPDAIQRATKRRSIAFHGLNSDEGLHAHEHLQRNPAPLPHSPIAPLSFRLELIADLPQQSFAPRDILIAFKPLGCCTVDDPKNCPTLFGRSDDHFYRIGCGAIYRANLCHVFERVQNIDWIEALAKENEKAVTRPDRLGVFLRELDHHRIRTAPADQTLSGGLAEGQAEPDPRDRGNECFMNVFDRFDEMRLAKNEVDRGRLFDFYADQFHYFAPVHSLG